MILQTYTRACRSGEMLRFVCQNLPLSILTPLPDGIPWVSIHVKSLFILAEVSALMSIETWLEFSTIIHKVAFCI